MGSRLPHLFVCGLLVATSSALGAQLQTTNVATSASPGQIDKTTQTEDIGFRTDQSDRMTVPVLVSGSGPYRFLVDTGADRTAVSRELAGKLRLAAAESASLHSVSGVSTVSTATVPAIQLTKKEIRNINAPLLAAGNMGADGILGTDSLRSQRILFDFQANSLSIVPAATPDFRVEPNTIVIQGARRNGRLVVTEASANGRPVTV
ncbi:MAG TPA: retropepsin-like aspartic protease, partial [Sphingomicrobium sp.]